MDRRGGHSSEQEKSGRRQNSQSSEEAYPTTFRPSASRANDSRHSQESSSRWRRRRNSPALRTDSSYRFNRQRDGNARTPHQKRHNGRWRHGSRSSSWSSQGHRSSMSDHCHRQRDFSYGGGARSSPVRKRDDGASWKRLRRKEDHEGTLRKLEHYKEPISASVVILRRVPLTLTENDLEEAIRSTAISLGFSPPNFIKLVVPTDPSTPQLTSTSAYVNFPSNDSAQVFYDACRKDFKVKNNRIYFQLPQCPPARLALLTSLHSPDEWAAVIDSMGDPRSFGPAIPFPNLEEFVMHSKSGLLFSEKAGLFYDVANQQFISFNGVYYVKSLTSPDTLIPIHELSAPSAAPKMPSSTFLNTTKAKILTDSLEAHDKKDDQATAEVFSMTPADSAVTKATAVASVLATAQLAARASLRAKPKASEAQAHGGSGTANNTDPTSCSMRSGGKDATEIPTIEALFGDAVLEEDVKNGTNVETQAEECSPTNEKGNLASRPDESKGVSELQEEYLFAEQFVCFVCIQQFRDAYHLSQHQTESLLHQKNCKLQGIQHTAAS